MSDIQPITGAVVVAIDGSGKPRVVAQGTIFPDVEAAGARVREILLGPAQYLDVVYAVATIGLVDGRKA